MVTIGYKLASEEHSPLTLVENAKKAEDAGFSFAMISDHYHPWISREGHSPFVWSTLGGISQSTQTLQLATGVTCPTMRMHPAIIAQAAATVACMLPGRFTFAVGSGENLNEHILGDRWPPADVRIEMLAEAVDLIRTLWQGGTRDYYGAYYTTENAQIFDIPQPLPDILVASEDERSAMLAARIGDGLVNAGKDVEETIQTFLDSGGRGKPCYLEFSAAFAESEAEGKRLAYERWPIPAFAGEMNRILPTPAHYEQLQTMITEDDVGSKVVCGPNADRYIEKIEKSADMGFDHICIHQIGDDQQGFIDFMQAEVMPSFTAGSMAGVTAGMAGAGGRDH
ncbi:MAG: TIGR03557 family F420-dependent LLM class oxidoreductase [Methanobacteriota archaeon]|nr:MAG: TIGR03557 family F420-dependent LLM class oxidoreductase [Euryarchaeota archaeon]